MSKFWNIAFLFSYFVSIQSQVPTKSYSSFENSTLEIIDGRDAEENELPYLVQLRESFNFYICTGSIIGAKWILTSGNCVEAIKSVVYGTDILYSQNDTDIVIRINQTYRHPKFRNRVTHIGILPTYDIGILELEEEIPFADNAQPIKLPDEDGEIPFHVDGAIGGWGVNTSTSSANYTRHLKTLSLQLLSDDECTEKLAVYGGYDIYDSFHYMCSYKKGSGHCSGDEGGSFVVNGIQYGIISWAFKPCGSSPGVYSRIVNPEYRNFIRNVTGI